MNPGSDPGDLERLFDPIAWQAGWARGHATGWRARGRLRRRATLAVIAGVCTLVLEHAALALGWL